MRRSMSGDEETVMTRYDKTDESGLHEQFPTYLKWREKNLRKMHFRYLRR